MAGVYCGRYCIHCIHCMVWYGFVCRICRVYIQTYMIYYIDIYIYILGGYSLQVRGNIRRMRVALRKVSFFMVRLRYHTPTRGVWWVGELIKKRVRHCPIHPPPLLFPCSPFFAASAYLAFHIIDSRSRSIFLYIFISIYLYYISMMIVYNKQFTFPAAGLATPPPSPGT